MSKHTPGPWTYAVFSAHYEEPGLTGWASSVYQDDNCHEDDICKMTHDFDKETVEANARLIAAAPDLLDALQRLLRANEADYEHLPDMDVRTAFETNSMAVKQAREAIAKATGEPQ